jgi:hypothetical protein
MVWWEKAGVSLNSAELLVVIKNDNVISLSSKMMLEMIFRMLKSLKKKVIPAKAGI